MTNAELRAREYLMHLNATAFARILKLRVWNGEPAGASMKPADLARAIQAAIDDDRAQEAPKHAADFERALRFQDHHGKSGGHHTARARKRK